MRKIAVFMFLVVFCAQNAFADLNLKLGCNVFGNFKVSKDDSFSSYDVVTSGSILILEYLTKVSEKFKVGAGTELMMGGRVDDIELDFNYFPVVYTTVEFNPFEAAPGVFLKGNLGYNLAFSISTEDKFFDSPYGNKKGGLHFALGAGYTFPFGIIAEAVYGYYNGEYSLTDSHGAISKGISASYTKLGINIGYRFKI